MSPADGVGIAIGINVGIGIGIGIEPTNPSAKLLAERVATQCELRQHDHTTIEQCLLLAAVVCGQRIAHQQARPRSQRTPAPSLVRFQTTGVDPRVQPAQRDLIGIGISDTVEHHESRRSPASGLLPRAERMVGVQVFRSMSLGLLAEMTLPRRDR
ncbi:MAG: hypothetical protein N838_25425 [Thiohalocapsa sp. PB-PSB1]|nr:MAG: hypothetical protein N838_25425 [Thiohalocapsa sp. PB-PSB1]